VFGALLWGLVAGSAFLLGGALALRVALGQGAIGLLMGFGGGSLIAAVSYELVDEAGQLASGGGTVALGLIIGSLAYLLATGRWTGGHGHLTARSLSAVVVPEAIVIVGSLIHGHLGPPVIAAVFLCGVPEGFAATKRLHASGRQARQILGLWLILALVCGAAAAIGYAVLDGARPGTVAIVMAIAGGAVLTELTTELVPEAYRQAGARTGTAAVVGFAMVFALSEVG
jgi:ZIP family zinc transporter